MKTRNIFPKFFQSQKPVSCLMGLISLFCLSATFLSAQSPTCSLTLTATVSDIQCLDNGSSDESDDTFTFTLVVTGGNPWGWSGGGIAMGNYGGTYTFGPYLISAGPVTFTVVDMDNPTCTTEVSVHPPDPCSPGALLGSIGDFVWNDGNSNGVQDAGEGGMEGVYVILYDANMTAMDTKISDVNGAYTFTDVTPGTYRIKFANPGGVEPSPQDAGGDDDIDSDQDLLGFTDFFTLDNGQTLNNMDGGFQAIPQPTCVLMVNVLNVNCLDDGTFTATIVVTGGNPWGWSGAGVTMGNYGEATLVGPFSSMGNIVSLTVVDMDNPSCVANFDVGPCEDICENVVDAGVIGYDESRCGPYDPEPIVSVEAPSGGSGELEYMWVSSRGSCPGGENRVIIEGANEETYDPGEILQTTWFRRCVRRAGCEWVETDCVVKTVTENCATGSCAIRTVLHTTSCTDGIEFAILTSDDFITGASNQANTYYIDDVKMIEQNNADARLMATLINTASSNFAFELDLTFFDRDIEGSPTLSSDCYTIDASDWYYYTHIAGTLKGLRALAGGEISISSSHALHIGTGGNLHEADVYGASAIFDLTVLTQPTSQLWWNDNADMSLHLEFDGAAPDCAGGLLEPMDTEWNNQSSITAGFEVFPNPVHRGNKATITTGLEETVTVTVINHLGTIVQQWTMNEKNRPLNTESLAEGLYFIQLQSEAKLPETKRLMIVR